MVEAINWTTLMIIVSDRRMTLLSCLVQNPNVKEPCPLPWTLSHRKRIQLMVINFPLLSIDADNRFLLAFFQFLVSAPPTLLVVYASETFVVSVFEFGSRPFLRFSEIVYLVHLMRFFFISWTKNWCPLKFREKKNKLEMFWSFSSTRDVRNLSRTR